MNWTDEQIEDVMNETFENAAVPGSELTAHGHAARLILEARAERDEARRERHEADFECVEAREERDELTRQFPGVHEMVEQRIASVEAQRDAALARVRGLEAEAEQQGDDYQSLGQELGDRIDALETELAELRKEVEAGGYLYSARIAANERLRQVLPEVLALLDEGTKEAESEDYYVGGMCSGHYPREAVELLRAAMEGGDE